MDVEVCFDTYYRYDDLTAILHAYAEAYPDLCRQIADVRLENLRQGVYRVTAVVQNAGLLPTNITDQAIRTGRAKPVRVAVEVGEGEVLHGAVQQRVGHLEGRISNLSGGRRRRYGSGRIGPAKATASWVVAAERGSVTIRVTSEKGGRDVRPVPLTMGSCPA